MQVKKTYSDTVDTGTSSTRTYSYGMPNTMSINERTDYFNQVVADFLEECGVDAAYEARGSNPDKYLWILGVPFLFVYAYNSSKKYGYNLYVPGSTAIYSTGIAYIFNGSTSTVSFSLLFAGNPKTAFVLRWIEYGATAVSNVPIEFFRAKNTLNGKASAVWRCGAAVGYDMSLGYRVIDMQDDGLPDMEHLVPDLLYCNTVLYIRDSTHTYQPDKILLEPLTVSIWALDGVYRMPLGYLPTPALMTAEQQTEIEIGGRKFLHTTHATHANYSGTYYPAVQSNYLNMGLVEVTGA